MYDAMLQITYNSRIDQRQWLGGGRGWLEYSEKGAGVKEKDVRVRLTLYDSVHFQQSAYWRYH